MKKITVTMMVDDTAVKAASGKDDFESAVFNELGCLHSSGMYISSLSLEEQKNNTIPPQVSVLCEEVEGTDGIRDFYVLGISEDRFGLRKLMERKIEQDEYGLIAKNGVDEHRNDHFISNFSDGFVEYYILDEPVLTKEELSRIAAGELDPDSIHREPAADDISVSKHGLRGLINHYIAELEEQEVMHAEIVSLLLDAFSRENLYELGFGEFIEDCLMTEQDLEEARRHAKTPLDTQISNAQAAQNAAVPDTLEKGNTLPGQGRE